MSKSFPGVRALSRVGLDLRPGRVHALVGENGAGKSTLVKILTGVMEPDEGTILVDGTAVRFAGPQDARALGIAAVFQELSVIPAMSVADNVMLGQERTEHGFVNRRWTRMTVRDALTRVGMRNIPIDSPAESLSLANRQLVEIARALVNKSQLLILDEPTAVLADDAVERLFALVRDLADDGAAVLYISHRLDEINKICDDVTILRDGQVVSTGAIANYDADRIVQEMVGRDVQTAFARQPVAGDARVVLEVRDLVPAGGRAPHATALDLDVRAGDVVGIAGLVGSGRSRILRTLAGINGRERGTVTVDGRIVRPTVRDAVRRGIAFVPEERKTEGLVLPLTCAANLSLASLRRVAPRFFLRRELERALFSTYSDTLKIRAAGPGQIAGQLSGGNQQKVVLAKWLATAPKVLLLDEPTRGIDVGARAEIYEIMRSLAKQGLAVVFVSSDLLELLGIATRLLVCRDGAIIAEANEDQLTSEWVMHMAFGTTEAAA